MFSPILHEVYKALFLNSREALRGRFPNNTSGSNKNMFGVIITLITSASGHEVRNSK